MQFVDGNSCQQCTFITALHYQRDQAADQKMAITTTLFVFVIRPFYKGEEQILSGTYMNAGRADRPAIILDPHLLLYKFQMIPATIGQGKQHQSSIINIRAVLSKFTPRTQHLQFWPPQSHYQEIFFLTRRDKNNKLPLPLDYKFHLLPVQSLKSTSVESVTIKSRSFLNQAVTGRTRTGTPQPHGSHIFNIIFIVTKPHIGKKPTIVMNWSTFIQMVSPPA